MAKNRMHEQAKTPAEKLNTIAQAARALRYLHDELDISNETYNRLKQRLREMAAENEEARLAQPHIDPMRVRGNRPTVKR